MVCERGDKEVEGKKRVVVDASVVARWFVKEEWGEKAPELDQITKRG